MTDAQFARSRGRVLHRDEMTKAVFRDAEPSGGRFDRVVMPEAVVPVEPSGGRFARVSFNGAMMRGVDLLDVQISGEIDKPTVNWVDVAPPTNTELDRHHLDWNPQSASVSVSGQGS